MYSSGLKSKSRNTAAYSQLPGLDCGSPTSWLCPPDESKNTLRSNRGAELSRSSNQSASDLHATYSRLSLSARSKKVFRSDSEDEEDDDLLSDSGMVPQNKRSVGASHASHRRTLSSGVYSDAGPIEVPPVTLNSLTSHKDILLTTLPTNESRIIAPNVSKLSPNSAVEIRLQSTKECVAVLCSVDVLKMRSGFFHDVLSQQDKARFVQKAAVAKANASSVAGVSVTNSAALSVTSNSHSRTTAHHSTTNSDLLWRDAITVPEANPFEAAAYLESLHEGRALFRGEWNHSWARLSVSWVIEDLMLEYSSQIDQHMRKVMDTVHDNHWRTNPNVLAGMRVAVFRKSANITPTIVTGVAVECLSNIGYSKLRVTFDGGMARKTDDDTLLIKHSSNGSAADSVTKADALPLKKLGNLVVDQPIVGDIGEPFWVQDTSENSVWMDPDEMFLHDSKRLITPTDKRVFWEMARSILDLPELHQQLSAGYIRGASDLAAVLKRPEFRVLWIPEAPEYIPKDIATELIAASYVNTPAGETRP